MPRGQSVDLDLLHKFLWKRTDRLGRIKIVQRDLAEDLGVTHYAINRILSRMTATGRIRRMATGHRNIGTYVVIDPEGWEDLSASP